MSKLADIYIRWDIYRMIRYTRILAVFIGREQMVVGDLGDFNLEIWTGCIVLV